MQLFNPDNHTRSAEHRRIYAIHELAYTINDVGAALLFIIGSVLFFNKATVDAGTWLFLIGSIMFGIRPLIKLVREVRYMRLRDYDDVSRCK